MINRSSTVSGIILWVLSVALSVSSYAGMASSSPDCGMGKSRAQDCASDVQHTSPLESSQSAEPHIGEASLVMIPSRMDNLYRYNVNSESDIVTFRNQSRNTLQQALTFYDSERRLSIMVRDFPSGQWSAPVDIHRHIGNDELEYDSHNATGLGIASDGTFFVSANQHVDPLRMAMTTRPYDITSFRQLPANSINDKDDDRVTYPAFAYMNEELYFSYREQEVGGGQPAFRWLLKKWNLVERRWDDAAQFNTGTKLRLYVSNIAWNDKGTQLHLAATWRDDRPKVLSGSTDQQHDLFHLYSSDGKQWKQYSAGDVRLPVVWTDPGQSTVPELIWNTGKGDPVPANAGSIAVDAHSYPHILNKERGGSLFYHYHDGRKWRSVENAFPSMSDDIFPLPDGMGAVSARGDAIYFHRLSPRIDRKGVLLAKGFVTRHFNASVDKTAIAHGWLSMMLTKNEHSAVNHKRGKYSTDAFVMNIPLATLDRFDTPFIRIQE